jgi:hypothetical protein
MIGIMFSELSHITLRSCMRYEHAYYVCGDLEWKFTRVTMRIPIFRPAKEVIR